MAFNLYYLNSIYTGKNNSTPLWELTHKKSDTELKLDNGRYYLYKVESIYDKTLKRSSKISSSILRKTTKTEGFVSSEKEISKGKSAKAYLNKDVLFATFKLSMHLEFRMSLSFNSPLVKKK